MDLLRVSGSLILFGTPAYFLIEIFYDPKYVGMRKDLLAKLSHYYHSSALPKSLFRHILSLVGGIKKGAVILDYDCGVGGFTRDIIQKEMPFKKIYAVDKSRQEIKVFRENLPKEHKEKVSIIYRKSWRIPEKIKNVDLFFSFNSLGYIEDIPSFLNHLRGVLKKKGRFCFYIKHSIINVSPNALIVEDHQKIKELFSKAKLTGTYRTRKKLFRKEIFIYGKKK
jgi:ubiquinone/menaquinone biosynthesis C-methylase UbiE